MRCLKAQVNGRRDSGVRTEDGVGQFEEGVAPTVEAFIERAAETVESIGTFHDAPIMHSPTTLRILYLPVELKRNSLLKKSLSGRSADQK
jgi:hypothetical protein